MGESSATLSESADRRHRPRRARTRGRVLLSLVALLAIATGLAIGGHIAWFYFRLHVEGGALVSKEQAEIRQAAENRTAACSAPWPTPTGPQGLLEVNSLGLIAPVLPETDDSALAVAVGHLSTSVWPGQSGTALLEAHDVSYFSRIDQLGRGSVIDFASPCRTFVYTVESSAVVPVGSPVYSDPSESRLVLVTCYPLNALFLTSQRYLVVANLKAIVPTKPSGTSTVPEAFTAPRVPAPAQLAAQGLGLATNDDQLGTLQLDGAPEASWQQSPGPIDDEASVIADYNAAIRSAEQGRRVWWQVLSAGVPFSAGAALEGAQIIEYTQRLIPTLNVRSRTLTGATVDAGIRIVGGAAPGRYHLTTTMTDAFGTLVITGWQFSPGS